MKTFFLLFQSNKRIKELGAQTVKKPLRAKRRQIIISINTNSVYLENGSVKLLCRVAFDISEQSFALAFYLITDLYSSLDKWSLFVNPFHELRMMYIHEVRLTRYSVVNFSNPRSLSDYLFLSTWQGLGVRGEQGWIMTVCID